jgi:hypothetical protein
LKRVNLGYDIAAAVILPGERPEKHRLEKHRLEKYRLEKYRLEKHRAERWDGGCGRPRARR